MTAYDLPLTAPPGLEYLLEPVVNPVLMLIDLILSIFFGG